MTEQSRQHDSAWTPDHSSVQSSGLGAWSIYFIAKFFLAWQGTLNFHAFPNLAFALLLLVPVSGTLLTRLRTVFAFVAAAMLLYHDSWLPSFSQIVTQLSVLKGFSLSYMLELSGRILSPSILIGAVILVCGYRLLSRRLRIDTFVMIALLALSGHQLFDSETAAAQTVIPTSVSGDAPLATATQTPDQMLAAFYQNEGKRMVDFTGPLADPGFDVLVMHVCSLAWDDLKQVGLDTHPLLARFDMLFSRFNTATPYSGPSAIRVLRANCGQSSQTDLYKPAAAGCYLFNNLANLGFKTELAMNHDGNFDDFLKLIRNEVGQNMPLQSQTGLQIGQRSFDDNPIYRDASVFNNWLALRSKDNSPHVATFYNTISLHDGNRVPDAPNLNTMESYKLRTGRLFDDINQFIDNLEKNNRKMILLLVPEHGAALKGDKLQFSGMREIPTPDITEVPAAIKVVGTSARPAQMKIDQPVSYLALSTILSRMLVKSPFGSDYQPSTYASPMPVTPYVAEHTGSIMIQQGNRYLLKQDGSDWREYPR